MSETKICKGLNRQTHKKCNRKVKDPTNDYCWQHDGQFVNKRTDVKYKTPIQHKIDNIKSDIENNKELSEYYAEKLVNSTDPDEIEDYSSKMARFQAELDDYETILKEFYNEQKNQPRDEKKVKVKGVVKRTNVGVQAREVEDKDVRHLSERFLKSFISTQNTYTYKKKNKTKF